MTVNNRGMMGQPTLPYVDYRSYAGADVFIDFTFLDHTGTPVTPTFLQYQLDDLTNNQNMIPITSVVPSSYQQTIQLPGSQLQMSNNQWNGSQVCQLLVTAVLTDSTSGSQSTVKGVSVIELCSIQTPAGY